MRCVFVANCYFLNYDITSLINKVRDLVVANSCPNTTK